MIGAVLGVIGCAMWAIGLAIFQPRVDREVFDYGTMHDVAENNSYWARDLRWFAILLAVAALVLIAKGGRRAVGLSLITGIVWLFADIVLDRLDVAGPTAAIVAGVVSSAAFLALAVVYKRVGGDGEWLLPVAITCVTLAVFVIHVQTPHDMVPFALAVSDAVLGAALMVTAVLLARAANPHNSVLLLAALLILPALAAAVVWHRYLYGETLSLPLVLVPWLAGSIAVTMLARPQSHLPVAAGLAVLCTLAIWVIVLGLVILGMPFADLLTATSGNPPVNAADSDVVLAIYAAIAGAVTGLIMNATPSRPVVTAN